ncbi:hypothetical protein FAVG1_10968 [Fusarium avenaceum]|nr:hypothetical protein FAVG1_10968 [Fusarium avenaceum]
MANAGKSTWRSLAGNSDLCGLCHKETIASTDNHPPRTSSVVPSRTSATLPPDQISLRSLPRASTAPVPSPQPTSSQPPSIPTPEPTPVAPVTPQVSSAPQAIPGPSDTSQVSSATIQQQADLRQLWDVAITNVKNSPDGEKLAEVIKIQQNTHSGDPDVTLKGLMSRLENEMKRAGLKGKIADLMGKVVPHLNRFAIVGDIAVSTSPNPAALPWAANLTAGEEIRGKIIEGIVEITILEFECSVYQEVHLASPNLSQQTTQQRLRDTIVEVFALSIKLLGFALQRQRAAMKSMTDAFRIEDFTSYMKDLATAKVRLHDAGQLCDTYHNYESRAQLKELHDLVRRDINEGAEDRARMQLKDLLIDPKDAFDHIYHPESSFCLAGTRVAVLQEIETWSSDSKSPCICWLPGLAGTGKSTISRTVARNLKSKSLGASFFFKTGAGNRGNGRFVFSTIAYQLALNFPPIRPHILGAVNENPPPAKAPMMVQWQRLILNPLSKLPDRDLGKPLILVIDALDECEENDRKQILQLLREFCPAALRVFITSRPELDIEGHFLAPLQVHHEIVLHRVDIGTIEQDITTFLKYTVEEFVVEYNQFHPQKHLQMDVNWPGNTRFQLLVQRSLPLFIAAATFIRMIKDRYWAMSPDNKIAFIIEESTKVNSEYDTLYRPVLGLILCECPEQSRGRVAQSFVDVVSSLILLASPLSVTALSNLLNTDAREVMCQIDVLRSVIDVPSDNGKIKLFHLSFRNYLLSKSAGELQVDQAECHAKLASRCINLLRKELKTNMCGLGSPGTRMREIDPAIVDKKLSAEVQDPGEDEQAQTILEFLQRFFSNWIEVYEDTTCKHFSVSGDDKIAVPMSDSIEIWDNNNGTLSQKVVIEDHEVYEVAFTDDDKFICSRSRRLERDEKSDDSELASQDSEKEFLTESEQGIMHIHNLSTGQCVRKFGCGVQFSALSFSPKGQWVTANGTMISRWDICGDFLWSKLESDDRHTVWEFSVDGTLLVSMAFDKENHFDLQRPLEIKVWCTESNKCLYMYTISDDELKPRGLTPLALTKDWLVYVSVEKEAVLIHLKTGKVTRRPDIQVFRGLAVSYDGEVLATEWLGVIKIWDLGSMSLAEPPDFHSWPVELVAPIADGNTIMSMTRREVKIWDISAGHCEATTQHIQYAESYFSSSLKLAIARNAPVYATWSIDEITIWHFDSVHGIQQLPQRYATAGYQLGNVAISANGQRLAAYLYGELHERCTVQIWDLKCASILQTFDCGKHLGDGDKTFVLALSHDGARVAYTIPDFIKVQDVLNPQPSTTRALSCSNDDFLSHLSFHHGRILAMKNGSIWEVFEDETGEEIGWCRRVRRGGNFRPHQNFINIEAFHGTNKQSRQRRSDITKPYHILRHERWLHKNEEDILWFPPDYVPESACMVGSTIIIGTGSGRLLFLYLRD